MEPLQIAAALASAILHAGWNAAVKADARPREAMRAQLLASALLGAVGLLWTGLPAMAAWPWLAASTACNLAAIAALLKSYESSGFGLAYPVCRALSVLLVTVLACALWGETVGAAGLGGIGLIALALLLLAFGSGTTLRGSSLGWIAAAGVGTAAYVLCDAQGVRQAGSPWAYGLTVGVVNGAAASGFYGLGGSPWRVLRNRPLRSAVNAAAALVSYVLIVWVWAAAPVAPASALRDTSAIFALLIAALWLKEPFTPVRLFAVLLAAAAMPLLRFA